MLQQPRILTSNFVYPMASNKHLMLSEFIKGLHQQLRDDSRKIGSEEAWNKHCSNKEQLQLYAQAMKELAINHWDNNMCGSSKKVSRIIWVYDVCLDYFWNNKLECYRNKEIEVAQKINVTLDKNQLVAYMHQPIKMLDVGSCYNPFSNYKEYFDVLPIDIAPATPDVFQCDFLKVDIDTYTEVNSDEVKKLGRNSFHVIVFSLLLEYLPNPELRLLCCQRAYNLLIHEGLLLIITPDSKHVGANAKLMKSWRFILAKLGLTRICYIKLQHIHCMAFRKSLSNKTAERWAELHQSESFYEEIFIPQDFNSTESHISSEKNVSYELEHLPNFSDIDLDDLF